MTSITHWACLLLALYIILESFSPLARMGDGCSCLCHKLKYLGALSAAASILLIASWKTLTFEHLVLCLAIALFILPRTVFRFHKRNLLNAS